MKSMIECYVNNGKGSYDPKLCIRILNIAQALFYCSKSVPLIDVYPSHDMKHDRPVFVFLFNRADTKQAYDEWVKRGKGIGSRNETDGIDG